MEKEYLKIPAYAKLKEYSPEYIRRLIAKGKITQKAIKRHGKCWLVNPEQANIDLAENLSQRIKQKKSKLKKIKKAGFENLSFAEAQTKNEQYKASLRKLEYEQKSGKLIPADEVEQEYFSIGRTIRDSLLNIPGRV